jgi:two-component system, NarL family, nitrate/nitrite response regulator NarL
MSLDTAIANRALAAGVRGILPKCISAGALSLSLKLIALGENVATIPSSLARSWRETSEAWPPIRTGRPSVPLSAREAEILQRLGAGSSNKAIALELGIAEATIKVHLKTLMRKINASNRTQAAMWFKTHQF